jgi:hypothetical protein
VTTILTWYPCERCGGKGSVKDGDYTVICPDCEGFGFPFGDEPDDKGDVLCVSCSWECDENGKCLNPECLKNPCFEKDCEESNDPAS